MIITRLSDRLDAFPLIFFDLLTVAISSFCYLPRPAKINGPISTGAVAFGANNVACCYCNENKAR